jgi:hypothetical protein
MQEHQLMLPTKIICLKVLSFTKCLGRESPDIEKTAQIELRALKPLVSKDSKSIL